MSFIGDTESEKIESLISTSDDDENEVTDLPKARELSFLYHI